MTLTLLLASAAPPASDPATATASAVLFTLAGLFALTLTASGVGYALSRPYSGFEKVAALMFLSLLGSCLGAAFCLYLALAP